jgi:phenylpyruvate tautomerase PptA (4-oxalocrotonate tautomerase family)
MPLVAIDLLQGRSREELAAIGEAVHDAAVEVLEIPARDRFQVLTEHAPHTLTFDPGYLDIERSECFVLVRLTLAAGRRAEVKQAFYARLAELLAERTGLRAEDLTVVLVENGREDYSWGLGRANYLELPREQWR